MKKRFGVTLFKRTKTGGNCSQFVVMLQNSGLHCGYRAEKKVEYEKYLKEELVEGRKEELPLHLETLSLTNRGKSLLTEILK